jgi:hypothetical protein
VRSDNQAWAATFHPCLIFIPLDDGIDLNCFSALGGDVGRHMAIVVLRKCPDNHIVLGGFIQDRPTCLFTGGTAFPGWH